VAGIITEVPTNPLIQSCDVPALAELARTHGAHLVLDASIASPWNVDVLRYCDVAVASLTKYAASEGDLLMGAAAVNPLAGDAAAFRSGLAAAISPPYRRDLARLAHEIRDVEGVVARINAATPQVVEYLGRRPEVVRIHWALAPGARANYLKVARTPEAVGSMVSFELQGLLYTQVYDHMRLPKGPSFGLKKSLCCPFMYLAHYDLVTSAAGRAQLAQHCLNPGLLRLSVGIEPVEDIIGVLDEALDSAAVA
jgi:cystathionine gamma-synthase